MTDSRDPRMDLPTSMHHPARLAILASLRHVESAEFGALKQAFAMSTPEMSRQLAILERDGLIEILKARRDRHAITQARLSEVGRTMFEEYLVNLRRISEGLPT
jgi:DNA-binding transcriptional ArsR family regulator